MNEEKQPPGTRSNENSLNHSGFSDISIDSHEEEAHVQDPHTPAYNGLRLGAMFNQIKKSFSSVIRPSSFINSNPGDVTPMENYLKIENLSATGTKKPEEEFELDSRLITEENKLSSTDKVLKRNRSTSQAMFFRALTFQKVDKDVKIKPNSKWKKIKQLYNGIKFGHL